MTYYLFNSLRPLRFGRSDFTLYVNYYHLGYVALGEYSKLHIPYNQQLYISYVISTNAEKSHPCKNQGRLCRPFCQLT